MNGKQVISIFIVVLGVLMVSTAQLTDLFGPVVAKSIVSVAALVNSILGGTLGVLTGQANIVKDAQAMEGVEKVIINKNANQTLASLAVDPLNDKIEAKVGNEGRVAAIAAGDVS